MRDAFRTSWWQRLLAAPSTYELTRFAILRLLALVYLVAFLSLARQLDPLLGSRGLLPVPPYLAGALAQLGPEAYWRIPTVFWLGAPDAAMHALCWAGVALSLLALLGVTHALVQLALWVLYLSFVHVGQIFYGYGWAGSTGRCGSSATARRAASRSSRSRGWCTWCGSCSAGTRRRGRCFSAIPSRTRRRDGFARASGATSSAASAGGGGRAGARASFSPRCRATTGPWAVRRRVRLVTRRPPGVRLARSRQRSAWT